MRIENYIDYEIIFNENPRELKPLIYNQYMKTYFARLVSSSKFILKAYFKSILRTVFNRFNYEIYHNSTKDLIISKNISEILDKISTSNTVKDLQKYRVNILRLFTR